MGNVKMQRRGAMGWRENLMVGLACVGVCLGALATVAFLSACDPPVSEEATVTIEGRALDADGKPIANQKIELWKSGVPIFDSEAVLGWAIGIGQPFRTAITDENGEYRFALSGAEANSENGNWAAYFAVSMDDGTDLAVASYEFSFSNQKLAEAVSDMQFWDPGDVALDADTMAFTWEASPTPPSDGEYLLIVGDGVWAEYTDQLTATVSTLALPATSDTHRFQVVAMGDQMRYRTSFKAFTQTNPRGAGLDYKQVDANNISATDCDGGNLFNLNDGVFAGGANVEAFSTSPGDAARCVTIKLASPTALSDIVVHNGWIAGMDSATTVIKVLPEGSDTWEIVDELNGKAGSLNSYYRHVNMPDKAVSSVQLEVVGGNARFDSLGEVVLYAQPE